MHRISYTKNTIQIRDENSEDLSSCQPGFDQPDAPVIIRGLPRSPNTKHMLEGSRPTANRACFPTRWGGGDTMIPKQMSLQRETQTHRHQCVPTRCTHTPQHEVCAADVGPWTSVTATPLWNPVVALTVAPRPSTHPTFWRAPEMPRKLKSNG